MSNVVRSYEAIEPRCGRYIYSMKLLSVVVVVKYCSSRSLNKCSECRSSNRQMNKYRDDARWK